MSKDLGQNQCECHSVDFYSAYDVRGDQFGRLWNGMTLIKLNKDNDQPSDDVSGAHRLARLV